MRSYYESTTTWYNINSDELVISEMGSGHIINCMKMMYRNGRSEGLHSLSAVGRYSLHTESFRRELRSRGGVLINVNRDSLAVL